MNLRNCFLRINATNQSIKFIAVLNSYLIILVYEISKTKSSTAWLLFRHQMRQFLCSSVSHKKEQMKNLLFHCIYCKVYILLTLNSTCQYTFDDILLTNNVEDNNWKDCKYQSCHHSAPVNLSMTLL